MTDILKSQPEYLTKEEFTDFREGDFADLKSQVGDLKDEVTELQQFTRDGFDKMDELITNTKIEIIDTLSGKIQESEDRLTNKFERRFTGLENQVGLLTVMTQKIADKIL
jgi:hypothetical protein